ncbi:MAG TPA: hypothetical protein PKA28_03865 [Methylomusa anaerophila]|nr:hypothetical protein [Methylomusa anaerophila]HML87565.1 hypothetical protein [Methylomusa anaerophila]
MRHISIANDVNTQTGGHDQLKVKAMQVRSSPRLELACRHYYTKEN